MKKIEEIQEINTQVVVIGGGPGGYSAAFRCADLGFDTVIIEQYPNLGGVCLNAGCIPSKYFLHISNIIQEINVLTKYEIFKTKLEYNLDKIKFWKSKIISEMNESLIKLAKMRNVKLLHGLGRFVDGNTVIVNKNKLETIVKFEHAIIAAGSSVKTIDSIGIDNNLIWNSTDALKLSFLPENLLIIGAGIIGLEMATVYSALGTKIDIVELFDYIINNADTDISKFYFNTISDKFNIMLNTKIINTEIKDNKVNVTFESNNRVFNKKYDAVLVSIGRVPNGKNLDYGELDIKINDYGFILVNDQMKTNISNIYAIGDIVGEPMLAHKSIYEGHLAAEVIAGNNYFFDPKVIPNVAYTNPEIAWVGLTEKEAKKIGMNYEVSKFPWSASGRAISSICTNGVTKIIFNKDNKRVIGGAIVGNNAGEIIGEIGLAIEMGCDAEDLSLTIHAHPTLSESISLASKVYLGNITDLITRK